jgi:hypothetical protein
MLMLLEAGAVVVYSGWACTAWQGGRGSLGCSNARAALLEASLLALLQACGQTSWRRCRPKLVKWPTCRSVALSTWRP